MAEKDKIFSSKIKYIGLFLFKEFYRFCYDWLTEETELFVSETKYSEKIKGDSKDIDIEWKGERKVTDYFKFEIKINFRILGMKKVQVSREGAKFNMDDGSIEAKVTGTLVKDYEGKFETTAFKKFLRSIYEKWVIPARVEQFEAKLVSDCDEFLSQAKAYLDIEGRR